MKADRLGALLTLGLGLLCYYEGSQLPVGFYGATGPGFLPMWVGVGFVLVSVPLLVKPSVGSRSVRDLLPQGAAGMRILVAMVALAAYTFFLETLGFLITTTLLFLLLLQLVDRGRWPVAIAISIVSVFASYFVFVKFFGLVLPTGLLPL